MTDKTENENNPDQDDVGEIIETKAATYGPASWWRLGLVVMAVGIFVYLLAM